MNEVVITLGQRDRVLGHEPRDPRGDGAAVDLLGQQHRALPRLDSLRRHELDRRQLVHLVVRHHSNCQGRRPLCRTGQRPVRRIGRPAGEDLVATGASGDEVHRAGSDRAENERHQRQQRTMIGSPRRDRWICRFLDWQPPGDRASDRDALTGFQRADHGAIDVALPFQRAPAFRSCAAHLALRVVELQTGEHHLEPTSFERLAGLR